MFWNIKRLIDISKSARKKIVMSNSFQYLLYYRY